MVIPMVDMKIEVSSAKGRKKGVNIHLWLDFFFCTLRSYLTKIAHSKNKGAKVTAGNGN